MLVVHASSESRPTLITQEFTFAWPKSLNHGNFFSQPNKQPGLLFVTF